jgi:hypothetical protein
VPATATATATAATASGSGSASVSGSNQRSVGTGLVDLFSLGDIDTDTDTDADADADADALWFASLGFGDETADHGTSTNSNSNISQGRVLADLNARICLDAAAAVISAAQLQHLHGPLHAPQTAPVSTSPDPTLDVHTVAAVLQSAPVLFQKLGLYALL